MDSVKENYEEILNRSIQDLDQQNKLVTFTIEELEAYTANKMAQMILAANDTLYLNDLREVYKDFETR